ncbi:MAG TPA: transcriptional regulator [Phycisphaerae bacterium]|nr:transcriptional regulator [Phycisphaerae bacterium]
MKASRVHRLLQLILLMRSGRKLGADALAQQLNVSRRTLFRDLDMLAKAGVPYRFDSRRGTYAISDTFFLPPLNLELPEALALLLVLRRFVTRQTVPIEADVARAAAKIEAALPSAMVEHCGSVLDAVEVRWPALSEAGSLDKVFVTLQQAIVEKRKVQLGYDSSFEGAEIETMLHPYRLAFVGRAWYVMGYSELHEAVRTFKLDRVLLAQPGDGQYRLDKPFDLDAYLGNAWQIIPEGKSYHVELVFAPMVAGNVEEVLWHRTQKTQRLADGSLLFEVDVDGLREISWWVLGYGDQVEVKAPPELRSRILEVVRRTATLYGNPQK